MYNILYTLGLLSNFNTILLFTELCCSILVTFSIIVFYIIAIIHYCLFSIIKLINYQRIQRELVWAKLSKIDYYD